MAHEMNEFESIINKYSKMIYKIAYSYTKNVYDSEDIVQDTFVKLYFCRKKFDTEDYLKYYLIRCAINRSLDYLRQKKHFIVNEELIKQSYIYQESKDNDETFIYDCILSLKKEYKNVIILFYYNKYGINEISNILKISEGNVKIRLNRARLKLREIIEKKEKKNGEW